MKKILLLDDEKNYLAETLKELKLAGCQLEYVTTSQEADAIIAEAKNDLGMVAIALNNALGYPATRKIKRSIHAETQVCVYSASDSTSLREWVYRQGIENFFTAPYQKEEFVDFCKKHLLKKNIHFSHKQLLGLTETLSKYTDAADNLVQQHAASSKSIQELQHKLAHSLNSFEHQKNFLTEVQ